jgi:phosphoribosylformylglycinamidine cyclo-ligase
VALIGGETAEMPGVYQKGEHDIAGVITGIVEKDKIITGERIKKGDIILGFPSSGLHTNGYSLARKLLISSSGKIDKKMGETLLKVHVNYCKPIFSLMDSGIDIKGIAHITGGGLIENIPRILPKVLDAEIDKGSWPMLPIFPYLQKIGKVGEEEMYRVFNMSIGLVIVVAEEQKEKIEEILTDHNIFWIGRIIKGSGEVKLV